MTCLVRVVPLAHARRAARVGSVGGVAFVLLTSAPLAAADGDISDAGAAAIIEALTVKKTVTKIDLQSACRAARGGLELSRDFHTIVCAPFGEA